jgi:hypothetical protein
VRTFFDTPTKYKLFSYNWYLRLLSGQWKSRYLLCVQNDPLLLLKNLNQQSDGCHSACVMWGDRSIFNKQSVKLPSITAAHLRTVFVLDGRSHWPRGLRRGYATSRLLGLRVRIPPPEGGMDASLL